MMSYIQTLLENASCIIPKNKKSGALWLGNYKSALDPVFLKDNKISVIINCTIDLPYIYDILDQEKHGLSKLQTFRIPVYDSLLEHDIIIMEQYLSTALSFTLKKLLTEQNNVLIHCYAGKQRSSCLCAATLFVLVDNDILTLKSKNDEIINIDNKSKLMNKIIEYMLEKRPCVFTYGFRVNFKKSLERFFNIKL
jgi:hypothetical protein